MAFATQTTQPSPASSSLHSAGGSHSATSRPRYASAPPLSSIDTADLNVVVPDGIWSHMSDGGRRLRLKSKEIVSVYVPVQWQPLFMDALELMCDHMQKHFSAFRRQVTTTNKRTSLSSSSSSRLENGGGGDDDDEPIPPNSNRPFSSSAAGSSSWSSPLSTSSSSSCSFENKAARLVLTLTFGSLTFYLVYAFLFESLLEFFLPFYAAFNCSYWFLLWLKRQRRRRRRRRRIRIDDDDFDRHHHHNNQRNDVGDQQQRRNINDDADDDDRTTRGGGVRVEGEDEEKNFKHFQKLICYFACLDLFLLFIRSTLESPIVKATVLHGLPVIILLFAQKIFSWFNDDSSITTSRITVRTNSVNDSDREENSDDDDDDDDDEYDAVDDGDEADDVNSCKLSTVNAYFVLIYVVRLFLCQGLTLIPFCLRPFFGYISTYLAFVGVAKRFESSDTGFKSDFSTSFFGGGGGNKVSFCSNCVERSGGVGGRSTTTSGIGFGAGGLFGGTSSNIGSSNINQIAFNMPTTGRPSIKIQHSADGGEPSSFQQKPGMGRASRRISLPAGSLMPIKTQSNLSEARGMIAELLVQRDLPPNIVTGLKTISRLLNPNPTAPTVHELLANLSLVLFVNLSVTKNVLSSFSESINARRQSVVTWSTVTSATGLPTLVPEPSRSRSSSYWKHKNEQEPQATQDAIAAADNLKDMLGRAMSLDQIDALIQTTDGTLFNVSMLDVDPNLANIRKWDFPIFEFYDSAPETILSRIAYATFRHSRLFNIFKISKQKFFNFFHALEKGYWDLPYHNRIHASDVLHATCYLTLNPVPALPDAQEGLSTIFSSLELLSLYTAAGMHDYDHPGKTNAFLVMTSDPKAILYNDRSVLENHHASSTWQMLMKPENNFVENLDPAEFKRFRYIVMEAILATDLKRHFEMLMEFDEKVSRRIDWENETDKLLVGQICIKMADINSPTKPYDLHRQWTNRILEEFYTQGDEEKRRGMSISPYMDRNEPNVAKLQDSFLAHLVKPLANALNNAGLLPIPESGLPEAELITNIENNHKFWKTELGEHLDDQPQPSGGGGGGVAQVKESPDSEGEMETIEEGEDEYNSS